MSSTPTLSRTTAGDRRLPVSWWTVGVLAVVVAFGNGFWVTSLQGAIGAIERTQGPFTHWLIYSSIMVPVLAAAAVGGLWLARRWVQPAWKPWVRFLASALLIVATMTAASIAEVSVNSAYDYHLQSQQLAVLHKLHDGHLAPAQAGTLPVVSKCDGLCDARHSTLAIHLRALRYASVVLLATNLVLVAWVLAVRGGRLWRIEHNEHAALAAEPDLQPVVAGALA